MKIELKYWFTFIIYLALNAEIAAAKPIKNHFVGHWTIDIDKTLFNIRIGCIEQRNKLIPKKHIFASSSHNWIHTIKKCEWYATTPNSKKITI